MLRLNKYEEITGLVRSLEDLGSERHMGAWSAMRRTSVGVSRSPLVEARPMLTVTLVCFLFPRPTPLPTGMRGWLETFANPFCAALAPNERGDFLDEVTAMLSPVLCDSQGRWTADYMRLRFAALKT